MNIDDNKILHVIVNKENDYIESAGLRSYFSNQLVNSPTISLIYSLFLAQNFK